MSQHLVLPINDFRLTAGYKNKAYHKAWGWIHYGIDCTNKSGNKTVYACGNGEVVAAGMDGAAATGTTSRLGNVIVVVYRDVLCADGVTRDLTARGYHFDSVKVKSGDMVTKDTVIGLYGNTGANTSGAHLHMEFDTDTKYPCLAPGIKSGGKIINRPEDIKKVGSAIDSTINPTLVWFVDNNQSVIGSTSSTAWSKDDIAIKQKPTDGNDLLFPSFLSELTVLIDKYKKLN